MKKETQRQTGHGENARNTAAMEAVQTTGRVRFKSPATALNWASNFHSPDVRSARPACRQCYRHHFAQHLCSTGAFNCGGEGSRARIRCKIAHAAPSMWRPAASRPPAPSSNGRTRFAGDASGLSCALSRGQSLSLQIDAARGFPRCAAFTRCAAGSWSQ